MPSSSSSSKIALESLSSPGPMHVKHRITCYVLYHPTYQTGPQGSWVRPVCGPWGLTSFILLFGRFYVWDFRGWENGNGSSSSKHIEGDMDCKKTGFCNNRKPIKKAFRCLTKACSFKLIWYIYECTKTYCLHFYVL